MLKGKEVYRSLEITDDIQTSKLGIIDQLRLLFANFSNDDSAELDTAEKMSTDKLRKVAALTNFIERALRRMDELQEASVTMKISSEFLPYIDEVMSNDTGYGRFYDYSVVKRDIPMYVKHCFILRISKRV